MRLLLLALLVATLLAMTGWVSFAGAQGARAAPDAPWQGMLRWTYTWNASSSGPERNLNVDFNAKAAEQWTVSGWSWSGY